MNQFAAYLLEIYNDIIGTSALYPEPTGFVRAFVLNPPVDPALIISFDIMMRPVMRLYELAWTYTKKL